MNDDLNQFFSALCDPGGHLVVCRRGQPKRPGQNPPAPFAFPEHQGPWEEVVPAALAEAEGRDLDLFLMPNSNGGATKLNDKGREHVDRRDASIKEFRALFLDRDAAQDGPLVGRDDEVVQVLSEHFAKCFPTSAEVESSPGRRHYYWFLDAALDAATWKADEQAVLRMALDALQQHYADELGGLTLEKFAERLTKEAREEDPKAEQITVGSLTGLDFTVVSPGQLLRLPGSLHVRKGCIASVLSCSGRKLGHDDLTALPAPVVKDRAPRPIARRTNSKQRRFNQVEDALEAAGLFLSEWHEGKRTVECYNADAHTDGNRGGAVLFAPSEQNGWNGVYKCSHTHCAHLDLKTARKALCENTTFEALGDAAQQAANTGTLFLAEDVVAGLWHQKTGLATLSVAGLDDAIVRTDTGWALREELALIVTGASLLVVLMDGIPENRVERLSVARLAAVMVAAGKVIKFVSPEPDFKEWVSGNVSLHTLMHLPNIDPMLWDEAEEIQTETLEAFRTLNADTSDDGVATTVLRNAGKGGLVCPDGAPDSRRFRVWNSATQRWDAVSHVDNAVSDVVRSLKQHSARLFSQSLLVGDVAADNLRKESARIAGWCKTVGGSERLRTSVAKILARDPALKVSPDLFDSNPDLVGVANGILDLRTGEVRPARREDCVSLFLDTPLCVELPQTPEAKRFYEFLDEVSALDHGDTSQESRARRQLLIEHCAFSLFGSNRLKGIQFWVGAGNNGKTVLANLLQDTLGDLASTFAPNAVFSDAPRKQDNQHGHTGGLNQLKDKRLGVCAELDKLSTVRAGVLKAITGDDPMSLRGLGQESMKYKLSLALLVLTNHLPRVPDADPAVLERFHLFDFCNKWANLNSAEGQEEAKARREAGLSELPVADKELATIFKHPSVKQAFLRLMVDAAIKLAANGFNFTVRPASITELYADYKRNNDLLATWLEESPWEAGNGYVRLKEVHGHYRVWQEEALRRPVSQDEFVARLQNTLKVLKSVKVLAILDEKTKPPKTSIVLANGSTPGHERGLFGLVKKVYVPLPDNVKPLQTIAAHPGLTPSPCLDDEVGT